MSLDRLFMEENIFKKTGPNLSTSDIETIENRLGVKFPEEYKQHLLKYNGGEPKRAWLSGLGNSEEPYNAFSSVIDYFYALYTDGNDRFDSFDDFFNIFQGRMPSHIFPIARDIAGNQICISAGAADHGYIYYWYHEEEADDDQEPDYRNLTLLAKNFKDFLEKLEYGRDDEE
jgi:cell wall assembly regulator SMI1